jgi:hypothetical protein
VPRRRFRLSRSALCKLVGLAGLAGVAASGAVLAREERRRRAYTPDEIRARLRERAEAAAPGPAGDPASASHAPPVIGT